MADTFINNHDSSMSAPLQRAELASNDALADEDASPDINAPGEADAEEELEELVIEDFTIDGICGVY